MPGPIQLELLLPDSTLVARARSYLSTGPSDAAALISHVCQIPGAPRAVAERMADALFERSKEFTRDAFGKWKLGIELSPGAPHAASPAQAPLRELSYVVVDVETTGTRAYAGDRITEVAAVHVRGGEIVEVFETLVNPERNIPSFITGLTRITAAMVKDAPRFREIAPRLSSALDGHLFVAHNAAFDWRFVSAELERASGTRLAGERLCTVRLARAFLPQIRRRSLDSLAFYFGVEITARHRAAGDAVATARVLLRLLHEAESRGCVTLEDVLGAGARSGKRRRRRRCSAWPRSSDGDFAA